MIAGEGGEAVLEGSRDHGEFHGDERLNAWGAWDGGWDIYSTCLLDILFCVCQRARSTLMAAVPTNIYALL